MNERRSLVVPVCITIITVAAIAGLTIQGIAEPAEPKHSIGSCE